MHRRGGCVLQFFCQRVDLCDALFVQRRENFNGVFRKTQILATLQHTLHHFRGHRRPAAVLDKSNGAVLVVPLRQVMDKVLDSYGRNPRELFLLFYYPSEAYLAWLGSVAELELYEEIVCEDLFEKMDSRERIVIFAVR